MITVRQLMQERDDTTMYTVTPDAKVLDALKLMADKNTGAVTVVDEQGQMVGIFSERDFARSSIIRGKCSLETPIQDLMTSSMITVKPETSLEECMQMMAEHHIRHLPVMENGRLVSMVSMRDVVEAILNAREDDIHNLENYILGTEYPK